MGEMAQLLSGQVHMEGAQQHRVLRRELRRLRCVRRPALSWQVTLELTRQQEWVRDAQTTNGVRLQPVGVPSENILGLRSPSPDPPKRSFLSKIALACWHRVGRLPLVCLGLPLAPTHSQVPAVLGGFLGLLCGSRLCLFFPLPGLFVARPMCEVLLAL